MLLRHLRGATKAAHHHHEPPTIRAWKGSPNTAKVFFPASPPLLVFLEVLLTPSFSVVDQACLEWRKGSKDSSVPSTPRLATDREPHVGQ
jgi:hypothetical protein